MSDLLGQIEAFALTLLLGLAAGTIFQFYQAVIRSAQVSRYALYLLDFSLWIIIIVLVFLSMLYINQGEMRIYVLIALLLGILIYYRLFAPRLNAAVIALAQMTVNAVAVLFAGFRKMTAWIKRKWVRLKPPPAEPPADGGAEN